MKTIRPKHHGRMQDSEEKGGIVPHHNFVRKFIFILLFIPVIALCSSAQAEEPMLESSGAAVPAHGGSQAITPITVTPIGTQHTAVLGTDGFYHLVYEIQLTNAGPVPATLERIDVLDADNPKHVYASYRHQKLLDRLHALIPAVSHASRHLDVDVSRLFFIELAFRPGQVPRAITEHLYFTASEGVVHPEQGSALDYSAGRITLAKAPLPVLGPPLEGNGWVDFNGCCSESVHRGAFMAVNGQLFDAQRFAIDYMRINGQRELVHGDPHRVENYMAYGQPVLAVADGTVVSVMDHLDDQVPGKLPVKSSLTVETILGNYVMLKIGHRLYAAYAHMKKGTITVHVGEHVKRGMIIGRVGNTGNTSAPHLHFQLGDSDVTPELSSTTI